MLSTDASDVGLGGTVCWSKNEKKEDKLSRRWPMHASKALSDSQRRHCTKNKELLAVVMAVELFRYYLTGRHFMVVTDQASQTGLHNFWEPEGMSHDG